MKCGCGGEIIPTPRFKWKSYKKPKYIRGHQPKSSRFQNCYPDLISLCWKYNGKVEKKEKIKYYEDLFMNKFNERSLLFWTGNKTKE